MPRSRAIPQQRGVQLALEELGFFSEEFKPLGTFPVNPFRRKGWEAPTRPGHLRRSPCRNSPSASLPPSCRPISPRSGREIEAVTAAGADWIHVDVMDNHFVPNLTIGPMVVKALRKHSTRPFDVHLMVTPVDPLVPAFAEAGADMISFHPEAGPHRRIARSSSSRAWARGQAWCSIRRRRSPPSSRCWATSISVLVMSVNPGFGGQAFIESQLAKIAALRKMIDALGRKIDLEVDGGVNPETARRCIKAGADVLVAGTAVFGGGPGALCRQHQGAARMKVSRQALAVARIEAGQGTPEEKARVMAWDRLCGMLSTLDSKVSVLLRFNAIVVAALAYVVVVRASDPFVTANATVKLMGLIIGHVSLLASVAELRLRLSGDQRRMGILRRTPRSPGRRRA